MAFFEAAAGDTIDLTFNNILGDGTITVSARVYDGTTLLSTETLSHVASGFYRSSYTIPTGYTKLAVFYIPSGTDNANAIDTIKIRSISPFGTLGAVSAGLNDDDIKEITKAIEKIKVWDAKLASGRTAAQELMAKSEFDVGQDTVKTDIVIPKVDLDVIEKSITPLISDVKTSFEKLSIELNAIDLSSVNNISTKLSQILPELKEAQQSLDLLAHETKEHRNLMMKEKNPDKNELQELILKSDELQQKRIQVSTLAILGMMEKVLKELRRSNGDFSKASSEFEKMKNALAGYNLKNIQNEMA